MSAEIITGDCLEVLQTLAAESFDAVVTDPPYGLGPQPPIHDLLRAWLSGEVFRARGGGFMGSKWDSIVPGPEIWREVFRVLKPGGLLLAFSSTRTSDLLGIALRLAGFEAVDTLQWVHGQGWPKGIDISKEIDKRAGAEREVVGPDPWASNHPNPSGKSVGQLYGDDPRGRNVTAPATPEAREWEGWKTQLKPAHEPVGVFRKPLAGTFVENVLEHGCGAFHVGACGIPRGDGIPEFEHLPGPNGNVYREGIGTSKRVGNTLREGYPANLIHDGSPEVLEWAARYGEHPSAGSQAVTKTPCSGGRTYFKDRLPGVNHSDSGGIERYFQCCPYAADDFDGLPWTTHPDATGLPYCGKAKPKERDDGVEGVESEGHIMGDQQLVRWPDGTLRPLKTKKHRRKNDHPTIKPTSLLAYLVRLVCRRGGRVLDPFAGTGTTGRGCVREGVNFVGIEREPRYADLARQRIAAALSAAGTLTAEQAGDLAPDGPRQLGLLGEVD